VSEIDWTGELALPPTGKAALTFGATGYIFPNSGGLTEESNSVELYGVAEFAMPLNPTALLSYDVGVVDGAYFEGGLSHSFALSPRTSLTIGGLAGFSAGQDAELDAEGEPQAKSYNFEKNGFTHADLWANMDFTLGSIAMTPTLHVIVTGDEETNYSKMERHPDTGLPDYNRTGAKVWFGVTLGWAR
jgi:hypothetical protein